MARFALLILTACLAVGSALRPQHAMQKRQIFREQVLPGSGGKIPEDAFRSDRLALNRLNKEGIAIPDGVLLEARHRESHFPSHRHDPDINASIIRLVQRPDGRYAPPEGRYPFNNLVESTYVIRAPINIHGYVGLPPRKPIPATLHLPAKPFFGSGEELLNINNLDNSDLLDTLNHDFPGTSLWTGFGPFFHDTANRILRHSGKGIKDQQTPSANRLVPQSSAFAASPTSFHGLGSANVRPGTYTTVVSKSRKTPSQLNKDIVRSAVRPLLAGQLQSTPKSPAQRLAIGYRQPGDPTSRPFGYPSLNKVPVTTFSCRGVARSMEPDPTTGCQVFHLCHPDGRKESFLCPAGTRYDKKANLCNPWRTVSC